MPKKFNQHQIIKKMEKLRDKIRDGKEITDKQENEFDALTQKLLAQHPKFVERHYTEEEIIAARQSLLNAIGYLVAEEMQLLTPQERAKYLDKNDLKRSVEWQNEWIRDTISNGMEIEIFGHPAF